MLICARVNSFRIINCIHRNLKLICKLSFFVMLLQTFAFHFLISLAKKRSKRKITNFCVYPYCEFMVRFNLFSQIDFNMLRRGFTLLTYLWEYKHLAFEYLFLSTDYESFCRIPMSLVYTLASPIPHVFAFVCLSITDYGHYYHVYYLFISH